MTDNDTLELRTTADAAAEAAWETAEQRLRLPAHYRVEELADGLGEEEFAALIETLLEATVQRERAGMPVLDAERIIRAADRALESDHANELDLRAPGEPPSGLDNDGIVAGIEGQHKRRQAVAMRQATDAREARRERNEALRDQEKREP